MAFNTTVNWANYSPTGRTGSTNCRAPSCALLTSGNIVMVYGEHGPSNGPAGFRIIDQNGTIVVDRTSLGVNIQNMGVIGVAALTGGGFAVALKQDGGSMQHGVFSNTGTVVTGLAADSNFGTSFDTFDIKPLSGGGYAIAAQQSSSTYGFRTYSSVGAGNTYVTATGWSSTAAVVLTTFSDNSFAALYPESTNSLKITRFSNTGTIVANYTAATDWYNQGGFDFITLSTGIGVLIYVENSANYFAFGRTYDQSTGAISGSNTVSGNFAQYVNAKALSGGGFVMTAPESSTGTMRLIRRNASFGQTGAVSLFGLPGYVTNTQAGRNQNTTIIEGATFLTIVDNSYTSTSYSYHTLPYVQVDKSNFTATGIRRRFNATALVATQAAPVSGYARANSTPNSAAFLAANTQTLTQSVPVTSGTTFALTPFLAINEAVRTQCMTDMNNGQFVIAYGTSAGPVRFTVFNPDGSVVTTITVNSANNNQSLVRCTCLGNGRLVVSWVPSSNDQVNFAVYSSSYVLLATSTISNIEGNGIQAPGSQNNSPGHDIAPFGNDFFVLATANSGNNVFASIFNDSAVYQSFATSSVSSSLLNIRVASDASGDVAIKSHSSGAGVGFISWFARNTANNTIYSYNAISISNSQNNNFGENMVMSPWGSVYTLVSGSGSTRFLARATPGSDYSTSGIGTVSYYGANLCVGQNGEIVMLFIDNASSSWRRFGVSGSQGAYGAGVATSVIDSQTFTVFSSNTSGSVGAQSQIVNLYDNVYAFSYITTAQTIFVGLLNTVATSYSATITAGVTPSNTALVPSPSNGYYLAGVSASECAAGGTGVLQINGAATLNSQYPAGTTSQAFDFNTPALDVGIRGTIAGRNLILSGGK